LRLWTKKVSDIWMNRHRLLKVTNSWW